MSDYEGSDAELSAILAQLDPTDLHAITAVARRLLADKPTTAGRRADSIVMAAWGLIAESVKTTTVKK